MLRSHGSILVKTLMIGSCAHVLPTTLAQGEESNVPPEPRVIFTDISDVGESLLVSPATESEQSDAAEALNLELGPTVINEEIPSGRWKVSPHLEARMTYDDNIFIQHDHKVDDFIFTLSPGLAIGIWDAEKRRTDGFLDRQNLATEIDKGRGSYFAVDYTAILLGFAKTDSQNAFDQDARMDARWQADKWSLSGVVQYESKSETNTDIGTRIRRKTFSAEVVASYRVSDKTAIDTSASFRANDPENYVRSTTWKVESEASYEMTPLVRVGIGGAVGGVETDGGSDDFFERVLTRAAYRFDEKLDFEVRGGVEFRQSDGAAGDRVNPIFSVRAGYEPAEGTRIGLEAFRSVETSEFRPEESYERTGVALTFLRSLRSGFHLRLDAGYQQSDYSGFADESGREDQYFFVRPNILYNFASWGNAALTYEFRKNDSNRTTSTFNNNQIKFQVNFAY